MHDYRGRKIKGKEARIKGNGLIYDGENYSNASNNAITIILFIFTDLGIYIIL